MNAEDRNLLDRYSTPEMKAIWSEKAKIALWLQVELAVLDARAKAGDLDPEIAKRLREQAEAIDLDCLLDRMAEIEKVNNHDLLAFVEAVREKLDPDLRGHLHAKMTSYDTEEIPMILRIVESLRLVTAAYDKLAETLRQKALEHKRTLLLGRTHGQAAELTTFGLRLLDWLDAVDNDLTCLADELSEIRIGKISGAVGTYPDLSPAIETVVCEHFGLIPARKSTQILNRAAIARVMNTLAVAAANIEHIALNFRLMARSDVGELREPFPKGQKGSSRMAHKQNTIRTEQLCGLARVVRAYAMVAQENVPTWEERDISQSAPERIILPDAFNLMHYMVRRLTAVIEGMQVFPERMLENIANTYGTIYSGKVKEFLIGMGMGPEVVYRWLQELSFEAVTKRRPLLGLLRESTDFKEYEVLAPQVLEALAECFEPMNSLPHLEDIFQRFDLQ